MPDQLPSCTNDLSSLPVASGCPAGSERVVMMGVAGGKGASQAAVRSVSDLKCFLTGAGSPEGVMTAPQGAVYEDTNGPVIYFKTTASGNTGWVSAGAGAFQGNLGTINQPTTTYYPSDTGGVMDSTSSVVDNVFIFNDASGSKVKRIVDGLYKAQWVLVGDGSNQLSKLQAVLNHSSVKTVVFDSNAGATYTLTGTLNCGGKTLRFADGNKITGTCTLDSAIIDAPYKSQIFASTTVTLTNARVLDKFSTCWYTAAASGADQVSQFQKAADTCILNNIKNMYTPAYTAQYVISKGVLLRKDSNGDGTLESFTLNWEGERRAYGNVGDTVLSLTATNSFAIGWQRAKGLRIANMSIQGVNTRIQDLGSTRKWCEDPSFDWGLSVYRNNSASPLAALCGDIGNSAVSAPNQYPGFTSFYTDPSSGGSSDVIIEGMDIRYFIVGIALNPAGLPQNGDIVRINNCWVQYCYSGISTGESQNRSILCNGVWCWGGVETMFDSKRYGDGTSNPFEVDGCNIAGGVRYLTRLSGFGNSHGFSIKRFHAELLYSLGGNFEGDTGDMLISDTWIQFTGNGLDDGDGTSTHHPISMFRGGNLTVVANTYLTFYGAGSGPISFSASSAVFDTVQLDDLPINSHPIGQTTYRNCRYGIFNFGDGGYIDCSPEFVPGQSPLFTNDMSLNTRFSNFDIYGSYQRRKIYMGAHAGGFTSKDASMIFVGTVAVSNILDPDNALGYTHCEFTLSTSADEFKMLQVGDKILGQATDEYGRANILHHFGTVVSKNGSTGLVVVKDIRRGLTVASYSLFLYRPHKVIPVFAIGNCTSGSVNVSGIIIEKAATQLPAGITIISPYFPDGTYLVSYDGAGNAVFSNPANTTVTGFDILSCDWKGRIQSSQPAPTSPQHIGYKKGDEIFNISPGRFNTVLKWVCVKSGITNTSTNPQFVAVEWYPDEFNTTTNNTSKTVEGYFTLNFKVKVASDLAAFTIGTSSGGGEISPAQPIFSADGWTTIAVNFFDPSITTIWFGGITGSISTDIKIIKSDPVAIT